MVIQMTILAICVIWNANGARNEYRLLNNLLEEYQKYERPVANESLPVSLSFTLHLQQIIDLDERNQLLVTNLWLDYTWTDANLVWNKVILNLSKSDDNITRTIKLLPMCSYGNLLCYEITLILDTIWRASGYTNSAGQVRNFQIYNIRKQTI